MTAPLRCRTYTHARRFPLVIGRIGGYALPTPLTPTQVVVLIAVVSIELSTRHWWARLPGVADLVVAMVVPLLAAWAVRHAVIEGRSPLRFLVGVIGYVARPRSGVRPGAASRRNGWSRLRSRG